MEPKHRLVELKNVTQKYSTNHRTFTALENINLTIDEKEFVTLLGPSGCGKSTLLRIITGLQRSTSGEVLYKNLPLVGVNPHAAIVFQTFALFPWLTVQQNVEVALEAREVPESIRTPRALDLLDRVGLAGFESAYPRELSGGMRQKVGFARAMAIEPELLSLDEPFSALDVLSAEGLRSDLLELWTSGNIPTQAILMVTHNIEEAVAMADRVIVMEKDPGRIVADFRIELPHPRYRKSPSFLDVVDRIYELLAGQTQPEHIEMGSAPGEPGPTRGLPRITVNGLAGLLEWLSDIPYYRSEFYRLADELKVDSNDLLSSAEAAELLGFATIAHGAVTLTPLGQAFADASILGRKDIFASRIKRLPIFRWLIGLLKAAQEKRLEFNVIERALSLEFPPEEAQRQLDTIIDLGRYAEILSYDDTSELVCLEPGVT